MLEVRDLVFRAGGGTLVDGVSLSLAPGTVLALLGRNGAGKSSLLRLIAGDLAPTSGVVRLNGRFLARWPAAQLARVRAVLPQAESLRFAFTVREVVTLGRLPCERHGAAREARIVGEALEAVGMQAMADRLYPTLSGGERARVQFARVIAQIWEPGDLGPRLLLLDEPTASLDLAHQHELLALTRRFAAADVGVVAVLHDPNLALAYADRTVLMAAGRVVAEGASAQVLTPAAIESVFGIAVDALPRSDGAAWLAARPRR